ncbi:MAG: 30S ribosomal protein S12 methylthiotransferase RimO [Ezakiella sp.]|nr:30S ribosomal protein S12 methylthiotransferase RimO [Ezakiella sp.]MDD7471911.1 30S ribosomal protein S12 methylthiotransferase RimO [Bacillota bacterium]MDY3923875.1 30S ribosomal protein S12 methylthiotransferase RimO [Ezakiella sp.]
MKNKLYFETLGCSKNDIDTEVMISVLDKTKFELTENPFEANIIVVNTCSFILDSKTQSIDAILEFSELKKHNLKYLIVAGCLGQRYPEDLLVEIPEIDGIIGTGEIGKINNFLGEVLLGKRPVFVGDVNSKYVEDSKRIDFKITQFVKISEGCDNHCTYCIIPKLRGKHRSRPIENIVDEVRYLVQNGTKEVILIAQNTTDYGVDLYGKRSLGKLIKALNSIENLEWIRILYMYPEGIDDELIDAIKNCDKVCKYVDMPLQHINDDVLKLMGRKIDKKHVLELINKLRREIPEIVIRTTFIVGFVNETSEAFEELKKFVAEYKLDKIGVFKYSLEEDTPAYKLGDNVSDEKKEDRFNALMALQQEVSYKKLNSKIGKHLRAIVESKGEMYVGRTYMDAPGIDGVVYIKSDKELEIGNFYDIIITEATQYDTIAKTI